MLLMVYIQTYLITVTSSLRRQETPHSGGDQTVVTTLLSRHGASHTGDALLPPTRQGRFEHVSIVTAQTSMGV